MNIEVTPGQFGFLLAAIGYLLFWALQLTVRVHTSPKIVVIGLYAVFSALGCSQWRDASLHWHLSLTSHLSLKQFKNHYCCCFCCPL